MKFLLPIMLLAATGAHANTNAPTIVNDVEGTTNGTSDGCLADYILDRCLETESSKVREVAQVHKQAHRLTCASAPSLHPDRLRLPMRRLSSHRHVRPPTPALLLHEPFLFVSLQLTHHVFSCFNNCPDDPRAVAAQTQAENTCRIASTSTTDSHTATATHTSSATKVTFTATTTSDEGSTSNTATFDAGSPDDNDSAAGSLTLAPGLFVGAAGVFFAAML
jgi:hypothetical protein